MKRPSLTAWIFGGMAAGIATGLLWPASGGALSPILEVFLRLVKSIVAPLLFATIVSGMAAAGNVKNMGRVALKAGVYFQTVSTLALLIGFAAAALMHTGAGVANPVAPSGAPAGTAAPSLISAIEHMVPASIVDAMARNEVLGIVVFTLLFGVACAAIGTKARPITEFADSLAEVMFRYTRYVMCMAPIGVAVAMAGAISRHGPAILSSLGKFVLVVCGAEVVLVACVLFPAAAIARLPSRRFLRAIREPAALAFSTASSDSALPLAIENMALFGVPKHIAGFVLATGCSLNLAGTTLYLAAASVFVARAAGVPLHFDQQLVVFLILLVTSKGVAAVPRSSYVILIGAITSVGVPAEAASIILGVDAMLDMLRTCINLTGNCVAAAVVARWEGVEFEATPASGNRLFFSIDKW